MIQSLISLLAAGVNNINGDALPQAKNLDASIPGVLRLFFFVAAMLAVIFVAIGGLKYVLSGGDPQGVAKAKNTILYALVGLLLAVFAFNIVGFVASRI